MPQTIAELYPELTPEEQAEAADNLRRYASLLVRAYERISHDPKAFAEFLTLTDPRKPPTMTDTSTG